MMKSYDFPALAQSFPHVTTHAFRTFSLARAFNPNPVVSRCSFSYSPNPFSHAARHAGAHALRISFPSLISPNRSALEHADRRVAVGGNPLPFSLDAAMTFTHASALIPRLRPTIFVPLSSMTFTEKDFSTAPYTENGSIGSSSVVVAAHGAVVIVIIVIAHANANADDADARGARPTDRSTESRVVATTGIGARIATTRVMTRRAVTRANRSVGRHTHRRVASSSSATRARARARAFFRHASRVLDRAFVRVEGFAVVAERDARRRARASRE